MSYVQYGTAVYDKEPEVVPRWKRRDEADRVRERFHGAFTGGFSAGYYNTVGSKEGWTPSTFTSSRRAAAAAAAAAASAAAPSFSERVQGIMDEEDQQTLTSLGAAAAYDTLGF